MNFFKSVFSEDSDPEDSPTSPSPNPNPWSFDTLIKTLASTSESYKRELDELTSGLKAETAVIRAAASRAARDFPASLEATAAAAQNSLETVGEAIDTLGSAVADIIGKDSILTVENNHGNSTSSNSRDLSPNRPYSRLESLIRSMQCDMNTYCKEIEELGEFEEWKLGFDLGGKRDEIESLIKENGEIEEIFEEVVPKLVDWETFWTRYFFRVYKVTKAEETRANLVKRAISGEDDEELSWDVEDEEERDVSGSRRESGDGYEIKANVSESRNVDELRKKLSALRREDEEGEDIGWVFDDDDEPLKSS